MRLILNEYLSICETCGHEFRLKTALPSKAVETIIAMRWVAGVDWHRLCCVARKIIHTSRMKRGLNYAGQFYADK